MFSKLFLHSPVRYIVSFVIMVGVLITYNCINGWQYLINYSNSLFIGGGIIIACGLFSMLDYFGFFNIARWIFVRRDMDGHKKTLYEYSEEKAEKNKNKKYRYFPYLLIGVITIIISAIILIINQSMIK